MDIKYEFRPVMEHIEVYINGTFQFSADSVGEAESEIGGADE